MNALATLPGGVLALSTPGFLPFTLAVLLVALALGFFGAPLIVWTVAGLALLWAAGAPAWLLGVAGALAVLFNVTPLRRAAVTAPILGFMKKMRFLPVISDTERTAIEAGTVWIDGELFSGKPDFARILGEPYPDLSPEERAFLDGPVEEACRMTDDWDVYRRGDLPEEVWDFLKQKGFFGMIIPKEYGGLGFSASANSAVVAKLGTRCQTLSISVMVPNSLGPAELLSHYGTEEQRRRWLPRLARGDEMPAFALTEPGAGSDAGSIQARGVLFRDDDGELKIRLDWNKRYITLAAISTVLGLAFKLDDPDELLGRGVHLGITCALIPSDTPGVVLGERHDPLGVPFYNCPTQGHDVVVPLDAIIGGEKGAGDGWRMLMETLAAGRGISLPALSAGGTKFVARVTGAYAAVRKQFGLPIGRFEGVEEPLARIGGWAYTLEAARRATCGGLDGGAKPPVVTAMAKYQFTEIFRKAINDAMDVVGGAGISRGPRNLLAHAYMGTPISITVEGANILTRTLMVFGQGAIRCHPYAYQEIVAAEKGDVAAFDRAFFGHIGHVVRNGARALVLTLTRGTAAGSPVTGPAAPYLRKLAWSSASFAFLADLSMGLLGGDLKRREKVAGRFSDVFAWMYLASCVARRFEAEGRKAEHLPFFHWSMRHALAQIQAGFDGLYRNLDLPLLGWFLRGPVALWSRLNPIGFEPSDRLGGKVAQALQEPGLVRDAITAGIHVPTDASEALGRLERAFELCTEADAVARKIRAAVKEQRLPKAKPATLVGPALEAGVITQQEADLVREAEAARDDAIQVDSFTADEYMHREHADPDPTPEPRGPLPEVATARRTGA